MRYEELIAALARFKEEAESPTQLALDLHAFLEFIKDSLVRLPDISHYTKD